MSRNFKAVYSEALCNLIECDFLDSCDEDYFFYFANYLRVLYLGYCCGEFNDEEFLRESKDAFNFMKERY